MGIHVRCYTDEGIEEAVDPTDISEHVGRDALVWVDLLDPTADDLACLQEEFSLHPLAMEDAAKHGQRPKLEQYPTHAFLVAYSAALAEVDLFVGPDWVVSVRAKNAAGEAWPVDHARDRFDMSVDKPKSVGFLVYLVLDELVDGYAGALDVSEDHVEALEERIFGDGGRGDEHRMQQELFALRRDLLHFRRAVAPLRDVLDELLQGGEKWVNDPTLVRLQDVEDHVIRAIDRVDAQRELVSNAVDSHLAIMSNHMNEVMKKMTSWGALLIGSTLIAGIYGMNFEHMPELGWRFGYAWALGLMVVLTMVGYRYFKAKDWV